MDWNEHYNFEGQHAFLSASSYHWTNYTPEKLEMVYRNNKAKEEGTILHAFASQAIQKRLKLARTKKTINLFVNDSIGFNMKSEQMLFYSTNAFGTADSISFKDSTLRIFDFKSGSVKASFTQLDIYAALFCLEYDINPLAIKIEQRIYQSNEYVEAYPIGESIQNLMKLIVEFDNLIEVFKKEV